MARKITVEVEAELRARSASGQSAAKLVEWLAGQSVFVSKAAVTKLPPSARGGGRRQPRQPAQRGCRASKGNQTVAAATADAPSAGPTPKRRMGRPTACTPDLQASLLKDVTAARPFEAAAEAAGSRLARCMKGSSAGGTGSIPAAHF